MTNKVSRRQMIGLLGTGTLVGVAGCGGGGGGGQTTGGGDGGGDDATPTATPTVTATPEATSEQTTTASDGGDGEFMKEQMGELVRDEIDEIEILGWTSRVLSDQSIFQVEVTIRNAGNQETRITPGAYALVVTYYDDGRSTLAEGRPNGVDKRTLQSGETARVRRNVELDDPSAVARYEISLTCDSSMGVYC